MPALPAGSCVVYRADQRGAITATAQPGAAASPAAPARPRRAQVFMSAEVAPWSKTGGLGDVVGALPIELAKRGHNVITIAPRYDQYWDAWDTGGGSLLQSWNQSRFPGICAQGTWFVVSSARFLPQRTTRVGCACSATAGTATARMQPRSTAPCFFHSPHAAC